MYKVYSDQEQKQVTNDCNVALVVNDPNGSYSTAVYEVLAADHTKPISSSIVDDPFVLGAPQCLFYNGVVLPFSAFAAVMQARMGPVEGSVYASSMWLRLGRGLGTTATDTSTVVDDICRHVQPDHNDERDIGQLRFDRRLRYVVSTLTTWQLHKLRNKYDDQPPTTPSTGDHDD